MSDSFAFLRLVPIFEELPDADLEQICRQTEEVRLRAGEILFEEGSPGTHAYIIQEGEIEIYKQSNGQLVQLSIRRPGEIIGEMSLLESSDRSASGRAVTDSLLISLSKEAFERLLETRPAMSRILLHTYLGRLRSTQLLLNQSEKMAQLGTLTAGIAHELNNPASAVRRGADQFGEALAQYDEVTRRLFALGLDSGQLAILQQLAARALNSGEGGYDPLERSDREAAFERWFDSQGVEDGWELSPMLVSAGYTAAEITRGLEGFPAESLPVLVRWIASRRNLEILRSEVGMAAGRISEIVRALKTYVYLDQSPVQNVNLIEDLENTLVILRHKLKQNIVLIRDYDPAVPTIQAYASELNQVWTNILDNAIDALDGSGQITIRTRYQPPWVVVDIADNGPGISPEIQGKLFSPFFTTKPVGKGTGLGLNISYNIVHKHRGDIRVHSQPGETHFEVWLPVNFNRAQEESFIRRENEPQS